MVAGTLPLIKLILRRDRVKLPVWIIGIVASLLSMVPMLRDVYGDEQSIATLFQTFGTNPAGLFLTGFMDAPTFGSLMTIETLLWWGLAVAFMNTLLVVRHTRQNEESGAQELILSGQVHRGASLMAVLVVAVIINAVIAAGLGAGLAAMESSWGADQAWLFGLSMGLFGLVWAVIAAVVAQLVEGARSANGMLAAMIGGAFVIRGIGDFMGSYGADKLLQPAWVSWASPFGWLQATRSLTFPEWWPLGIFAVFAVVGVPVAFLLLNMRDVGAGLLPSRKGRARASAFLKTPLGLTWHLQKNVFTGWLLGTLALAATVGMLAPEMTSVYESSESMKDMIVALGGTGALIPSFLSAMLAITVLMVVAYGIHALGKLRGEEASGHLENLLATRLSRLKWLGLHGGVVVVGGALMLAATGAVLAVCVNVLSDFEVGVWEYTAAGLYYLPLLLAFVGAYVLLFGLLPRVSGLMVWMYYGFVAFMTWLGPMLKLDQRILDLSLTAHLAAVPAEEASSAPLVYMAAAGLVMFGVGLAFWRHRNLLER